MGNMLLRRGLRGGFLALMLVILASGSAFGVTFNLTAGETTLTMPDGRQVPAWGFGLNGGPIMVPGPVLTVPPGEGLTINLTNNLPEPTSLNILGQMLTNNAGPVWTEGTSETQIGTGQRPSLTARVRSFSHETAENGGVGVYEWANFRPGTYLAESGTNPAKQCQMGLRLVVKQDVGLNEAHTGVNYDQELVVVFSEIDPEIQDAIAGGYYGANAGPAPAGKTVITSSAYREPHYFLINGMAFPNAGLDPINGSVQIDPNDEVLIRFVNAGLKTHMPQMPDIYMQEVAEDGNPHLNPKSSYGIELPAGNTKDVIIQPTDPAALRLFDGRLYVFNAAGGAYGGMLTYIKVSDAAQRVLTVDPEPVWGSVQSASLPGGIYCPGGLGACDESYNFDTDVRLAAIPMPSKFFAGSQFLDWAGAGSTVAGDRIITMDTPGDLTASASFQKLAAIGVFRSGSWFFETNGNRVWDAATDVSVSFGMTGDIPITGDWNGDGITEVGVFRNGAWFLDSNGNGALDPNEDITIPNGSFGLPTDIPITGDWNDDGITDIGVFRNGAWFLDSDGSWDWNAGLDTTIPAGSFGLPTDIPITGDWDGNGVTDIGVFRNGAWFLDSDGSRDWNAGSDTTIPAGSFGLPADIPITGNWNNDLITDIGVFRNGAWFLDGDGSRSWNAGLDISIPAGSFGLGTDVPVTGR